MGHGLNGFDNHQDQSSESSSIEKFILAVVLAVMVLAGGATMARADVNPSSYQYVKYGLVGKKNAVSLSFDSGFNLDKALKNTPSSILMTNIVFPKELLPQNRYFPTCPVETILNSPQDCPEKSLIATGSGESLLRPKSNKSGAIISKLNISLHMYNNSKNKVYIRAYSNLSNRLILEGTILKSNDKRYSRVLSFVFPRGANTPVPGVIVQLQRMRLFVSGNYRGKNLFSLRCKTGKKLGFSYWSAFNINGETANANEDVFRINDLVISAVGNPLKQTVSCPK